MEEERKPNRNTIIKTIYTLVIALLLIIIWGMNHAISTMQQQVNQLQQEVSSLQSSISSQINGISTSIDESLKKANSIVSDYSYHIQPEKINRKERTVPIELSVRPKEDQTGLSAVFLIETEDGKTIRAPGQKIDSNTYHATVSIPTVDYLKLSVTFDDGVHQKSEKLEDIYQPFETYFMKVDSISSLSSTFSGSSTSSHKIKFDGTVDTTITESSDGSNFPTDAKIQIFKNEKLVKSLPIELTAKESSDESRNTEEQAVAAALNGSCTTYYTPFKETFTLKTNEVLKIVTIVEDNYGFHYKQAIYSERIDGDGNPDPTNYSGEVVIE